MVASILVECAEGAVRDVLVAIAAPASWANMMVARRADTLISRMEAELTAPAPSGIQESGLLVFFVALDVKHRASGR